MKEKIDVTIFKIVQVFIVSNLSSKCVIKVMLIHCAKHVQIKILACFFGSP